MRKLLLWSLLMLAGAPLVAQEIGTDDEPGCGHAKRSAARWAAELAPPPASPVDDPNNDTDLLHYFLDIEVNPTTEWLGGTNTMTVRSLVNDLTTFDFRLHNVLPITDVRVNNFPATWNRVDSVYVRVTLDRPYMANEEFEVLVAYAGYPQSGGMGSITFEMRNGSIPTMYTLSEPWLSYTWWPGKDSLPDKSTADLRFTVPAPLVAASNGTLILVDQPAAGKLRYHWRTNYPTADYLYCVGITNYTPFESTWTPPGGGPPMPLKFFIYPESDNPTNRNGWLGCGPALTVFSKLFGEYPFLNEKYGMLQFGWSGGMEHQTMTSMGGFWDWIVVHELAHQWWGDNVTCATWHDIWLNEGFATYAEALHAENQSGTPNEAALHSYMATRRPSSVNGTVYCFDISNIDRIFSTSFSYRKGGWVLHMLRHVLGTETFYDVLAEYRALYSGKGATSVEFQAVAEAVSGRDLDWYFNEWLYLPGAPVYQWAYRAHAIDGKGYLELYIKQNQQASYPTFTMPIDIAVTSGTTPTTYVAWNDAKIEHLLLPLANPTVTSVAFDPKPWILRTGLSTVTFVEGPPKIVTLTPAPGAAVAAPAEIEVVFHKAVNAAADRFTLVGERSGPATFAYTYDAQRRAAKLAPTAALPSDTYTLTVSELITDTAASLKLDGELAQPDSPAALPSGDGLAGGSAIAKFYVVRRGDMNCDGAVNFVDINPFVQALSDPAGYQAALPGCPIWNGDINVDGKVDFFDINAFVALLSGPQ